MRWCTLFAFYVIAGFFATMVPGDLAQSNTPTATEDSLASKIRCQDFHKNSDGEWTSDHATRIGKTDFSDHTFGIGEVEIGGADLAAILDRKCKAR
jgi:hypothetical protein